MYSFKNDYSEGCHPKILDALSKANFEQNDGYGDDGYSVRARHLIRSIIENPDADIHFVSGGTQANLIVIGATLRSHEAVVCAATGHIAVHEAGAIEATGHKVIMVVSDDGKVTPAMIQAVLNSHNDVPHMVKPKMVYISNSTEVGTVYRLRELKELWQFCKRNSLYLFMDGARLGSALCSADCDITLADISKYTDVFYIGGTKNGALLGEAIIINNLILQEDFGYHVKQRGALLAKGQLIGIQFLILFQRNLMFNLAHHANAMAAKLTKALDERGFQFLTKSSTNQIFPILPNSVIEELAQRYGFYVWEKLSDDKSAIRLVTSWATKEEAVDDFIISLTKICLRTNS